MCGGLSIDPRDCLLRPSAKRAPPPIGASRKDLSERHNWRRARKPCPQYPDRSVAATDQVFLNRSMQHWDIFSLRRNEENEEGEGGRKQSAFHQRRWTSSSCWRVRELTAQSDATPSARRGWRCSIWQSINIFDSPNDISSNCEWSFSIYSIARISAFPCINCLRRDWEGRWGRAWVRGRCRWG